LGFLEIKKEIKKNEKNFNKKRPSVRKQPKKEKKVGLGQSPGTF